MPRYLFIHIRRMRDRMSSGYASDILPAVWIFKSVRADYTVMWKYAAALPTRATDGSRRRGASNEQNTSRRKREKALAPLRLLSLCRLTARHVVAPQLFTAVARDRLNCPSDLDAFTHWPELHIGLCDRQCVGSPVKYDNFIQSIKQQGPR